MNAFKPFDRVRDANNRGAIFIGYRSDDIAEIHRDDDPETDFVCVEDLRLDSTEPDLYTAVPQELKDLSRWITWGGDPKDKRPFISGTNTPASTTNPDHLVTFGQAIENIRAGRGYAHLGFVPQHPFVGMDLDSCRNPETGAVQQWATEFLEQIEKSTGSKTYVEITPSGAGLRAWVKAPHLTVKKVFKIKPEFAAVEGKAPQIEPLVNNYGTITGQQYAGAPAVVIEINEQQWRAIRRHMLQFGAAKVASAASGMEQQEQINASPDGPPIPVGSQYNELLRIAGVLRNVSMNPEEIEEHLLKVCERRCPGLTDNYKERCHNLAHGIGKKPVGGSTLALPEIDETPLAPEEPLPEFPLMTGTIAELADALAPDIPREYKLMAAVTRLGLSLSGRTQLTEEPWQQPRFYTCLLGERWTGKGATLKETRVLGSLVDPVINNIREIPSIDSGPALVDAFAEYKFDDDSLSRVLLVSDELKSLFEKGKMAKDGRNSLFTELLTLWEDNVTGNRSKKTGTTEVANAHLAILSTTQPAVYEQIWTGTAGGTGGLQSRITLVTSNSGRLPDVQKLADNNAVQNAIARLRKQTRFADKYTVSGSPAAMKMFKEWWKTTKDREEAVTARIPDMMKRLLMVLAPTNDTHEVDQRLMGIAIRFGEYEIALRERFNPKDSYSWVQAFEQEIVRILKKRGSPTSSRDLITASNAYHKPGGIEVFLRAMRSLTQSEIIRISATNRSKKPLYTFVG